jgi:hypothetical protein
MKKEIPFLVGVGIIVAVAIAVGVFLHYQEAGQPSGTVITPTSTSSGSATSSSAYPITYTNNVYGFTFSLPADWQGYAIVTSTWNGNGDETCPATGCPPVTGPEVLIRNPQWTAANPWQNIPILVFTHSEWDAVASGTLITSAAPIPPSDLGENTNYVFALPARYDYAYPNGWQEVESIIQSDPLHGFNVSVSAPTSVDYFNGKQVCRTDSDCPANDVCTVAGPILANQQTPATCWPKGSAVPL